MTVTKTIIKQDINAPNISRVTKNGVEHVVGHRQYADLLVPVDSNVTVEVKINGITQTILGPWVASSLNKKTSLVNVRLRVRDDCELIKFSEVSILGE